jgi:chitin disaccharide deacetylase
MKQLVVNADDLAMTRGINRAVIEAHRAGIVKSTSLIANGAAFDDAISLLRQSPGLSAGLHVNITEGRPLASGGSSLVDRRGFFHRPPALAIRLSIGAVSMRDLEDEITAQAQRVLDAGISISHFDSHHNVHLHPMAAAALANVAHRMKVRWIRFRGQRPILPDVDGVPFWIHLDTRARHVVAMLGFQLCMRRDHGSGSPRWIIGTPQLRRYSPRHLFDAIVRSSREGITEWVCHPGYADEELCAMLPARAARMREAELKVLADTDTRMRLDNAGIELVGYADLDG